jgi:hypothetical protein
MNVGLIARLVRAEARYQPAPKRWDMSGLATDELELLAGLPGTEVALRAHIDSLTDFDWSALSRVVARLVELQ